MSIDRPDTSVANEGMPRARHLSFVGRQADLEALQQAVRAGVAVSLYGPPGIGKSRLVTEFVEERRSSGEHWVVLDLRQCRQPADFESQVAEVLQADDRESPDNLNAGHLGALCRVRGLDGVVFETFDHLVSEADLVARWQAAAESTSTIVVSRARLPGSVAHGVRLDPMPVDDAVALFADRAREARKGFRLDEVRDEVVEIVERLDRLPLAIELAAARMSFLDPPAMLARLSRRFELLQPGSASRLPTFEDAIDWSWQLLGAEQRAGVRACARFVAPFTLEAAEAVIGAGALRIVDELVAAAWLQVAPVGDREQLRFSMLESLRTFATDRESRESEATETDRGENVDGRFIDYHLEIIARLSAALETPSARNALERFDRERKNVRRALELALYKRPDVALDALWSLRPLFMMRGASGALSMFETAVEVAEKADNPASLVRALCLLGEAAFAAGRSRLASDCLERSFGIVRDLDDDRLFAEVARASSIPLAELDVELGARRLEAAREHAEGIDDPVLNARILERQGYVQLRMFQLADAERKFERARDATALVGSHLYSAGIVSGLAYVSLRRGQYDQAIAAFEEAVQLQHRYGGPARQAGARYNLAAALHGLGKLDRASEELQRARHIWEELGLGELLGLARLLEGALAHERGDSDKADVAFRAAISSSRDAGDLHNRAIAEGWWGLSRATDDLGRGPIGLLEDSVATLDHVRAPDAAAAFLAALAAMYASDGDRKAADRAIDRLGSIASWLSEEDEHLRRVLDTISSIARLFNAADPPSAGRARSFLERDVGLGEDVDAWRTAVAEWPNAFVRDLLRRVTSLAVGPESDEDEFTLDPDDYDVVVTIHREGHWFRIGEDEPVDLLVRRAIRGIAACLLEQHLTRPHAGVSVETLIEAGWPGEVMTPDSGKTRVYSAVRILRELGMRDLLVTDDAGYHFAEDVGVQPTREPFPS